MNKIIISVLLLVIITMSIFMICESSKENDISVIYKNMMIKDIENIDGIKNWSISGYVNDFYSNDDIYYVNIEINKRDTNMKFSRNFHLSGKINENIKSIINEIDKLK